MQTVRASARFATEGLRGCAEIQDPPFALSALLEVLGINAKFFASCSQGHLRSLRPVHFHELRFCGSGSC